MERATVWLLRSMAGSCHSAEAVIVPPIFGNCFGTNWQIRHYGPSCLRGKDEGGPLLNR